MHTFGITQIVPHNSEKMRKWVSQQPVREVLERPLHTYNWRTRLLQSSDEPWVQTNKSRTSHGLGRCNVMPSKNASAFCCQLLPCHEWGCSGFPFLVATTCLLEKTGTRGGSTWHKGGTGFAQPLLGTHCLMKLFVCILFIILVKIKIRII